MTHPKRSGFTLLEAMIAVTILSLIAVAVVSSMVHASTMVRINSNSITAKNIAQGLFERMAIDEFADVNAVTYPDIPYPPAGTNPNTPGTFWLDRAMGIPCRIDFDFKGFGVLSSATSGSLSDATANWTPGEWAGDTVFIVSGGGAGLFAVIRDNTSNRLDLDELLMFTPGAGARYMINNGKTVEITTFWNYRGREYQQTIESLVCNFRNSDNLGF